MAWLARIALLVLLVAPAAGHAQSVTRAEFDALKRYTADLATGMKLIDDKRRASEAQLLAHKAAINALLADAHNGNCNYNGLVAVLAQWSQVRAVGTPAITYDPDAGHWVSCVDRTKPAPKLPVTDLP